MEEEGDNMSLLGYPDWAVDEQGEERPWVTGPSPISQALTAAGLGLLSRGSKVDPWIWGGIDLSGIGEAGLLGLDQYGKATQNLHGARKDFYDARSDRESQIRENRKLQLEEEERNRLLNINKSMVTGLPNLLKQLEGTNIPGIQNRIPVLRAQAEGGDIKGAYQSATNLTSQLAKVTKGKPEIIKLDNGQSVMVQKDSAGGFTIVSGQSFSESSPFGSGMKPKAYGIMLKALKGVPGFESDSMKVQVAYESLQEPKYVSEFNPETGQYMEVERDPYIPPSFKAFMEGEIDSSTAGTKPPTKQVLKKVAAIPQGERASAGYANRMQKAMYTMDELMTKGYRPSRTALQFVIMGAPQTYKGRLEKEAYRKAMSPDDRIFARAVQDFLRAKLRKESGAVIGVEEAAEEVEAFFNVPSPGTGRSPDAVSDKYREARISALESMIGESGPAYTRWKDLGFNKQPRNSKYFYDNSPFAKKELSKKQKIKNRFNK